MTARRPRRDVPHHATETRDMDAVSARAVRAFHVNHDPRFLWLGANHRAVLETLSAAVLRGSPLLVLTGEVGAGKTMLTDAVAARLVADGAVVGRLTYPIQEPDDFWNAVADAFGLVTGSGGRDAARMRVTDLVQQAAQTSRRVLLAIDEAQALTRDVLAEVARACDAVRDAGAPNVLTVLLVGEDALARTLASPELGDLVARIGLRRRLEALGEREVASYVLHRLACAEAPADVFTLDALKALATTSRGIPRLINTLSARAVARGGVVDAATVERCAREMVWLADDGSHHTNVDGTSLRSALRKPRSARLALAVAALLAAVGAGALALTKGGEDPVLSRRAIAVPAAAVTPPLESLRPTPVTAPAPPRADAESALLRDRVAVSRDGAPPSAAQPPPTVKTIPRREGDRTAASTGGAKRPGLPNVPDTGIPPRPSPARPDEITKDPDPGDIIDWLLKDRSPTATLSR